MVLAHVAVRRKRRIRERESGRGGMKVGANDHHC